MIKKTLLIMLGGICILSGLVFTTFFVYGADFDATISVDNSVIREGKKIIITTDIKHSAKLKEIILEKHGNREKIWEKSKEVSGTSALTIWRDISFESGLYCYCAYFIIANEQERISIGCLSVDVCENQCSYIGRVECYDNIHKRTCGNYFEEDPCSEWSPLEDCSGVDYCGYGDCSNNQKPRWYCFGGECVYDCVDNSFCGLSCQDECFSAESRCFDNFNIEICKDYNNDGCLEWPSFSEVCSGYTFCGYESCFDNQKPSWYCSKGECVYECIEDFFCKVSCKDECLFKSQIQCVNDYKQICDYYDSDSCLEWSSFQSCTGNTSCGYYEQGQEDCADNERPSWYCDSSAGECKYSCVYGSGCEISAPPISFVPPSDLSSLETDIVISVLGKKELESPERWKKEISIRSKEEMNILLRVKNDSQDDFTNVNVRVQLPKDIIYKGDLRIGKISLEGNIEEGINIGFFPSGSEREISFKIKVFPSIAEEKIEIIGNINIKDLSLIFPENGKAKDKSVSDSLKISIEKPKKGPIKWFIHEFYTWFRNFFH